MAATKANKKYPDGVKPGSDVTPSQLAKILKVGRSTIQDWIRDGLINHDIIGPTDPDSKRKVIRRIPWSEVLRLRKRVTA